MIGALLLVAGVVSLAAGWWLLRRGGSSWRIGRLLAAAPQRSLAEARALASGGPPAYVRLHGRVDSDEEFPGDDGTPLVFRRRQLQRRETTRLGGTAWQTFDDERLAVPFRLAERGERVGVDVDTLGDGLVVVPRLAEGSAIDVASVDPGGPAQGMAPETPVRLRIEQVATSDHATACGVPRLEDDGAVVLGPGLGRPLVLTNLALDEAMRVLGAERRRSLVVATVLLVAAPLALAAGLLLVLLGW
jgi:hypothetical protein